MKVTHENLHEHAAKHTKGDSWWLNDSQGIPLARVCGDCEEVRRATYNPAVFGSRSEYQEMADGAGESIEADE